MTSLYSVIAFAAIFICIEVANGTSVKGPCDAALAKMENKPAPPPGSEASQIPVCTHNGDFRRQQCIGSTGYCWCVDPKTGVEIEGTRKSPKEARRDDCGTCKLKRDADLAKMKNEPPPPPGSDASQIPVCTHDGDFRRQQCFGSTGYCWCVDPKTGEEIEGTRKSPKDAQRDDCGPCTLKREAMMNNEPLPGSIESQVPECTPYGDFEREQCSGSTGYCWCVDPKTGVEIEGTQKAPKETRGAKCGSDSGMPPLLVPKHM